MPPSTSPRDRHPSRSPGSAARSGGGSATAGGGDGGGSSRTVGRVTVEELVAEARAELDRLEPAAAAAEQAAGAVVVDIRPVAFRADEGEIPGALVVERNVLEWRFEPGGEWALPAAGADRRVVVVCNEGYTSSLAAYALRRIGVRRATDVVGGYRAWKDAGLPTGPGGSPALP
jgi:rhodanese-related sulfurtransferase